MVSELKSKYYAAKDKRSMQKITNSSSSSDKNISLIRSCQSSLLFNKRMDSPEHKKQIQFSRAEIYDKHTNKKTDEKYISNMNFIQMDLRIKAIGNNKRKCETHNLKKLKTKANLNCCTSSA